MPNIDPEFLCLELSICSKTKNKVCPKDSYILSSINQLVDEALGYKVLSFLDTYSSYNLIRMYQSNKKKNLYNEGT
ncbi:hypothetical protein CR513_54313, partial [Mucuna pruriens]